MTYFIVRAHRGTGVNQANAGKTRERFWKNAGEWTWRVEIIKEGIPRGKRSKYAYIHLQALNIDIIKTDPDNNYNVPHHVLKASKQKQTQKQKRAQ